MTAMSETMLPATRTPCTAAGLYSALRAAPGAEDCSRAAMLVLLSHWALETGFGAACWNWNLGNKKHVPGDGHDWTMFRCNEIIGGRVQWFDPPNPATWFVAFESLDAGARDYLMGLRGRFRAAWPAVLAGDPVEFCHLLKLQHYYTADEGLYTAGVVRCYHQLDASIAQDDPHFDGMDHRECPTQPDLPQVPDEEPAA